MNKIAPLQIAVYMHDANSNSQRSLASHIAQQCSLPLLEADQTTDGYDMLVRVDYEGVGIEVLRADESNADLIGGHPVRITFDARDVRSSQGRRLDQPIYRAIGLLQKRDAPLHIVDATAGFAQDSYMFAHVGCKVTLLERQPLLACLLEHAIQQLTFASPELASRMTLVHADGIDWLAKQLPENRPDIVYLDPMFNSSRKAKERKAMRVLRMLAGDDADVCELWQRAMACATRRVVVKRPRKAPRLAVEQQPVATHKGSAVRYDVYAVHR